jgi:hypothetical protein
LLNCFARELVAIVELRSLVYYVALWDEMRVELLEHCLKILALINPPFYWLWEFETSKDFICFFAHGVD